MDPNGLQGFAIDAGGGYGSGGGGRNSSGSDYGTGIFVGVRPNSGGHAQLGGFTYKSNAEVVPKHRFGGGYTLTITMAMQNIFSMELSIILLATSLAFHT